jgi:hypothetical protein
MCYYYSIKILKNSVFGKLVWGEFWGERTFGRLTPGVREGKPPQNVGVNTRKKRDRQSRQLPQRRRD